MVIFGHFLRELDVLSRQFACFNLHSCATTLGSLSRLVCLVLINWHSPLSARAFGTIMMKLFCSGAVAAKDDYHGWDRKTG